MSEFNKNLVALRKAAQISQKDFAQMLNIPISTLSGYENGGREPKFDLLIKMAELLTVSIDDLLKSDLDEKFNVAYRDKFLSELRFQLIGDSLVVNLPRERREEFILAMQIAADFLLFSSSLITENGCKELHKKFILKWFDENSKNETKEESVND